MFLSDLFNPPVKIEPFNFFMDLNDIKLSYTRKPMKKTCYLLNGRTVV